MTNQIAIPIGLFQAGPSGAGGQFEPLTPKTHLDFMQRMGGRLPYALDFLEGFSPSDDNCIIDIVWDGITIKDPHKSTPMQFITDYPSQRDRGYWYGYVNSPQIRYLTRPGTHNIEIKVSPRKSAQAIRTRDFSAEAGGVIRTFQLEILPDTQVSSD